MSNSSAPRRPQAYGLPSNPRQASSSRQAASQSSVPQRPVTPSSNSTSPRSLPPSRARSRSREPVASGSDTPARRSTSRPASRPRYPPTSRSVVSSSSSDYGPPREDVSSLRSRPKASWTSRPPSTRVDSPVEEPLEEPDERIPTNQATAEAAPLWKQVVATLTVNVSKALSATVGEGDGEATPVGAESRLTKAMKTYYLSKARNQADLPDWLFSDSERRVTSRRQKSRPPPEEVQEEPRPRHWTALSEDSKPLPATRPQLSGSASTRKDFRTAENTADRLAALRERGRHVEKAASTSRIPVGGSRR